MKEVCATKRTKVHSLINKVNSKTNLSMTWEKVKANQGVGGVDKVSISAFSKVAEEELEKLHKELKMQIYTPLPVRRSIYQNEATRDRVCQQALKNRLEPIFEPIMEGN